MPRCAATGSPSDEPTNLPDGALLESVSTEDILSNGGDLLTTEERVALHEDLATFLVEAEAGETIDFAETIAELREGTDDDG